MSRRVTFVTPRYGADVHGGAEQGARSLAVGLAAEGWDVQVLSSCARSHVTWADEFAAGETLEEGVRVNRFRVDHPRDPGFDRLSDRVLPKAGSVSSAEAWDWIDRQGPASAALLDAVAEVDGGVLGFYPYLYQPTARGILRARVPSVMHGACHPEPALGLRIFEQVFGAASGFAHHSRAEQDLILERFPSTSGHPQVVLGLPIEVDGPVDPERARSALGLGDEPFVVALGRIDIGKGTHELVRRFSDFRARTGRGRLVLAGPVIDALPETDGVVVLGPVDAEHKFGLLAAADVLINPSPHESFSIVVPEAFLVGTPVLVNGWCLPLREHCENSGGGLWYTGIADFEVALSRLLGSESLRQNMADAGRRYAEGFFCWESVRARYEALLDRLD